MSAVLIKLGIRLVVFTLVFWVAAKKNEKIAQKVEARKAAGLDTTVEELQRKEATKKKVYTPFPPAQIPRKVRSLFRIFITPKVTNIFQFLYFHDTTGRFTTRIWRILPQANGEGGQRDRQEEKKGTPSRKSISFIQLLT